jgi:hypothetical protein
MSAGRRETASLTQFSFIQLPGRSSALWEGPTALIEKLCSSHTSGRKLKCSIRQVSLLSLEPKGVHIFSRKSNHTVKRKVKSKNVLGLNYLNIMRWRLMGSGGIPPLFLTPAVDGGEWSVSRPGRFTLRQRDRGTYCMRLNGLESQSGLCGEERNFLPLTGIEPCPSSPQFVAVPTGLMWCNR